MEMKEHDHGEDFFFIFLDANNKGVWKELNM
jgi:hypothetical protein